MRHLLPRGVALALLGAGAPLPAAVEITGVADDVAANVRAFLRLDERACDADQRIIRRELAEAPEQIRAALAAFGFYAPAVDVSLDTAADCWTARIAIAPGEPVRVRMLDVQIQGAARDDPAFTAAASSAALGAGGALHHGRYEQLKRRSLDLARDRGYPNARYLESRIDVYPEDLAADVTLHFDSGERYRFGEVALRQEVLRDDFVAAHLSRPGEPYNSARLTETYVNPRCRTSPSRASCTCRAPRSRSRSSPLKRCGLPPTASCTARPRLMSCGRCECARTCASRSATTFSTAARTLRPT